MDVGMEQQVLSPRVQDGEEPDLGSQVFGIRRDLQEGFGDRAEQQVVEFGFVLQDQRVQFMRQSEDHMEIACRQEFLSLPPQSNADALESDILGSGDYGMSYTKSQGCRHIEGRRRYDRPEPTCGIARWRP